MDELKQIYREKLVSRLHALETSEAVLLRYQTAVKTVRHIAKTLCNAVDFADLVAAANAVLTATDIEISEPLAILINLLVSWPVHSEADKSHSQMILASLQQAQDVLSNRVHQQEALDSIQRLAHSLRGSGGTYGFHSITDKATLVEEAAETEVATQLQHLILELKQVTTEVTLTQTKLLILDDDEDIQQLLQGILAGSGRMLLSAQTVAEAYPILQNHEIDLIILDLILPDMDGRQFLINLKNQAEYAHIPVVVLTAKGSFPSAECFALGADGYFTKPFDPIILAAVISEKLQHHKIFLQEARQDQLTALPNRSAFHEAFKRMSSQSNRNNTPLALAILDLDHFKRINDTYGHPIGDQVLVRTAEILTAKLRQSDAVARWGGEEFVVLFPETTPQGAQLALSHVLEMLRQESFQCQYQTFSVTFSAGVTAVNHGSSLDEAIADADQRLYLAKASGRNQVVTDLDICQPHKGNILLAEDDDLVASMVKFRFEKDGFNVLHCHAGTEALNTLKETAVDMIILDIKMPEMDGFQVLKMIRANPDLDKTPVLMLTSIGNEKQIVQAFESGANDYMIKPFSPMELQARVYRHLKA